MRTIVLALVAAMATTTASAMDLGRGFALNTEVVAEHKVDAATTTLVATPELGYTLGKATVTAGTELSVWDNNGGFTLTDEFDALPTIDFGASYMLRDNLELEALSSYNFDSKERGEITVRATFAF